MFLKIVVNTVVLAIVESPELVVTGLNMLFVDCTVELDDKVELLNPLLDKRLSGIFIAFVHVLRLTLQLFVMHKHETALVEFGPSGKIIAKLVEVSS